MGVGNLQKVVCNVTKNKGGKGGGEGSLATVRKGHEFPVRKAQLIGYWYENTQNRLGAPNTIILAL